jgi:hypothetical protein
MPQPSPKHTHAKRMSKRFWVSFDVGLTSSFEKLYTWLDDNQSEECGDNVATFTSTKSYETLVRELQTVAKPSRGMRVYLIGVSQTDGTPRIRGMFTSGRRKAAPWVGFGATTKPGEKDEG